MDKNKSILDLVKKLPIEIIRKIYIDYIKPELIYNKLLVILNSFESKNLKSIQLNNFINIVISNDIVLKYLIKNDEVFNQIYNTHMVKGIKKFTNASNHLESMCLCWLMYLYH